MIGRVQFDMNIIVRLWSSLFVSWFLKGHLISKQNCRALTSPKKMNETHSGCYPECFSFIFWEKLLLDNFVSRSTDLCIINWKSFSDRFSYIDVSTFERNIITKFWISKILTIFLISNMKLQNRSDTNVNLRSLKAKYGYIYVMHKGLPYTQIPLATFLSPFSQ